MNKSEEKIIRNARKGAWNMAIGLLAKDIDMDLITCILCIKKEDFEEVKNAIDHELYEERKRIAISLTDPELSLSAEQIEERTNIKRMEFILV